MQNEIKMYEIVYKKKTPQKIINKHFHFLDQNEALLKYQLILKELSYVNDFEDYSESTLNINLIRFIDYDLESNN